MPALSRREDESGTVTRALEPLNESALPYLPAVDQAAVPIDPPFPLPDASATLVPPPSLNEYAATSPVDAAGVVAEAVVEYGPRLRAASWARTRYE
jgi:hypothetical protein